MGCVVTVDLSQVQARVEVSRNETTALAGRVASGPSDLDDIPHVAIPARKHSQFRRTD